MAQGRSRSGSRASRLRLHGRRAGATLAGRFLGHSAVRQIILDEIRNERKGRTVG